MGKHEREIVFTAEIALNNLLNEKEISTNQKNHELFNCINALGKRINSDFPNIQKSEHVGNVYGTSIGNIKLTLTDEREVYIELKFLKGGTGTRANISQNSLTIFNFFKGDNIKSWSDFRESNKHSKWVEEYLDEYGNYPPKIEDIKGKNRIYEKAGYLKQVLGVEKENTMTVVKRIFSNPSSPHDKLKAGKIVEKIMERDHKEKIEYINYLETLNQDSDNIKKFLFLILAGAHTHDLLERQWRVPLQKILKVFKKDYCVYYIYKDTLRVKLEDFSEKLKKLVDKEIFVSFKKNQTNVFISFVNEGGNEIPILRVVFHWKNKFQGIQTPCLNIFDETYLIENSTSNQLETISLAHF